MNKNENIHEIIEKTIETHSAFGDALTIEEKQVFIDYGVVHSSIKGEVLCRQGSLSNSTIPDSAEELTQCLKNIESAIDQGLK